MTNVNPPFAQISDPECPTETWWGLAYLWPKEAMQSPLFPLLTLENPGRWIQLENNWLTRWIEEGKKQLSAAQRLAFEADLRTNGPYDPSHDRSYATTHPAERSLWLDRHHVFWRWQWQRLREYLREKAP